MFVKADNWFDGLALGSVVHYHDGFGQYVRCTVVVGDEDNLRSYDNRVRDRDLIGKHVLLPSALVGAWRGGGRATIDPRTGEVHHVYHAEAIAKGRGAWRPSDSFVFEAPGFVDRSKGADPATLDALDLTPEPLTSEQLAALPAWRTIAQIQEVLSMDAADGKTPQEILAAVRAALDA